MTTSLSPPHAWRSLAGADAAIFQDVLRAAALPTLAFVVHIGNADVKAALIASTNEAIVRAVFGSPTFFVGGEMFFGKYRLRDVEEEYLRQADRAPTEGAV